MILLLLDKIAESGNKELILILKAWQMIEYKKVKTRIQEVIDVLEKIEGGIEMKNDHEVISFTATKKWLSIPEETRRKLERNVWCATCLDVVQIEKYIVKESKAGIVLHGNCKKCGQEVARVID
jgi:hypothetical protein